jgi:hypothetical protein
VIPVYSLLLVCFPPLPSAHETAGATGIRHSPRPQGGERFVNDSGASRGEIAKACLKFKYRHCERSEAIHLAAQRKNGLLRFARNARLPTLSRRRPRRRAIQYPEASVIESKSCGVLDTPLSRSMTTCCGAARQPKSVTSLRGPACQPWLSKRRSDRPSNKQSMTKSESDVPAILTQKKSPARRGNRAGLSCPVALAFTRGPGTSW